MKKSICKKQIILPQVSSPFAANIFKSPVDTNYYKELFGDSSSSGRYVSSLSFLLRPSSKTTVFLLYSKKWALLNFCNMITYISYMNRFLKVDFQQRSRLWSRNTV